MYALAARGTTPFGTLATPSVETLCIHRSLASSSLAQALHLVTDSTHFVNFAKKIPSMRQQAVRLLLLRALQAVLLLLIRNLTTLRRKQERKFTLRLTSVYPDYWRRNPDRWFGEKSDRKDRQGELEVATYEWIDSSLSKKKSGNKYAFWSSTLRLFLEGAAPIRGNCCLRRLLVGR